MGTLCSPKLIPPNFRIRLWKQIRLERNSSMATYEETKIQSPQVYLNFRGAELRQSFIAHLEMALIRGGVNVYVDILNREDSLSDCIFKGIEESTVALVIFSKGYTQSSWCLDELVKIKERVEQKKLMAIPIFYKLSPSEVKRLDGEFGDNLWKLGKRSDFDKLKQWKKALEFFTLKIGFVFNDKSNEPALLNDVVKHVHMALSCLPREADKAQLRKDDDLNLRKDDDFLSETNSDAAPELQDTEEKKHENVSESSTIVTLDQNPGVFINFQGAELRHGFVAYVKEALERKGVNVFEEESEGKIDLTNICKRIEEQKIALVIFSRRYTESASCLDELLKIKERVEQNKLMAIPIFYKLGVSEVRNLDGEFGYNFRKLSKHSEVDKLNKWKEALEFLTTRLGFMLDEYSSEPALVNNIVKHVHKALSCLPKEADSAELRKDDDLKLRKDDDVLSETNSDATPELHDTEEKKQENVSESSTRVTYDQNCGVFINFRGAELRYNFVAYVQEALKRNGFDVFEKENEGMNLTDIFKRIEDQKIALIIFSRRYTESAWCLDELVKIKEGVEQKKLMAIPIFYKLSPSEVKRLDGEFGDNLRKLGKHSEFDKLKQWKEALEFFTKMIGFVYKENSNEPALVNNIVKHVHMALSCLPREADKAQLRKDDDLNLRKDDDFHSETNSGATPELQDTEEKKQENISESSTRVTYNQNRGVFINFRGTDLRRDFVTYVKKALKRKGVDIFEEEIMLRGESFVNLFKRIEEFKIALVILSSRYTESAWCLNELVKITELMDEGKLVAIPIFYKVEPSQVRNLTGVFGDNFRRLCHVNQDHHINIKWNEALKSMTNKLGFCLNKHTSESEIITHIVKEVLKIIRELEGEKPSLFGIEQRMEQLEKKLEFDGNDTQIIGVVGMPGIGKTTLAVMLHEKWKRKFLCCVPFLDIHKKSEEYGPLWLRKRLLELLLKGKAPEISDETTHGSVKDELLKVKIFAILDDVSDKIQLEFLLGKLDWIKKGSKIIITTSDKSLLEGFADDTYVVPKLNDREAFQLFSYHALRGQNYNSTSNLVTLSKMFVDYAQGHPWTLRLLGRELYAKDEVHWASKLEMMTKQSNMMFQDVWKFYTDQLKLSETQKDVFLDIACFFQSEDEYFVRSLLDSGDPDSSEVKDLVNKFLITIADGRVEMNVPLYKFSKDLGSPRWLRLWNYQEIINVLTETGVNANNVRGLFLDTSKLKEMCFEASTFIDMQNLRYLKIYDSCCPRQCKADCQLIFPDGFEFPLGEVRYLHWVKFPLEELPPDFRPENLVDLRLPYSKITRVWEGEKDTPRLKWVDLSHSSELLDLSALSKAENLQRLNLEGCTSLDELPVEIQNMKSLVFLNLRGCIRLWSLPEMNLISLKTLILSDCSNLEEFQLISESVEFLHLDGTAITGLPQAIQKLRRLVVLNLKNCKMLACLPNCLGNLKALDKLILSGCSRLKNLPDVTNSLKHLRILLFDETGAKKMPSISCFTGSEGPDSVDMFLQPLGSRCSVREWPLSSLRRLCLSGNDFVSLQPDIGELYNLKWLDVKHCKKLRSVPMLPPILQYFDAHGCDSLQTVANPFAFAVLSDQIHANFNFSNCNKLDQKAKDNIISYTRWRSQLVRDELTQCNGGLVSEALIGTCFPGWEVPVWFSHQASGSVLKPELLAHWYDNKFTGIGLCAVIEFDGYHNLRKRVLLKCNCEFKNEDGSSNRFSCTVGGWSEPSNTPRKLVSSHVFIGFTSGLDIDNISDDKECVCTETFIEFKVTDGMEEIEGCKVVKCGFSLLYAPEERGNICPDIKSL